MDRKQSSGAQVGTFDLGECFCEVTCIHGHETRLFNIGRAQSQEEGALRRRCRSQPELYLQVLEDCGMHRDMIPIKGVLSAGLKNPRTREATP